MTSASTTFNGTAGNTPTGMSGTYPMDAFSSLPSGAGACALNATQSISGSMAARCTDTTKNAGQWDYGTLSWYTYFRGYFYLTAAPSQGFAVHSRAHNGWSNWTRALITSDRRLAVAERLDAYTQLGAGVTDSTAAGVVPLNEWFRIESSIIYTPGGSNDDTAVVKMWKASGAGEHSNGTPDATVTIVYNGGATSGWFFGPNSYDAAERTFLPSGQFLYMDEFAIDTASWIGPIDTASWIGPLGSASFVGMVPM